MFYRKYGFGLKKNDPDIVCVQKEDLYSSETGFGFVTERNRREQELLKIPELNAAFHEFYWYGSETLSCIESDGDGCFLDSDGMVRKLEEKAGEKMRGEHRWIPLSFKTDVPEQGNYKVTVTIRATERLEEVLIFTGRRRLGFKGRIPAGGVLTHTMVVPVCDFIPRGKNSVYEDKTLDITVVAARPRITEIEVEGMDCPTIYIAGDSTVTDQSTEYPYAPGTSYCGWGQMLGAYLKNTVAVSNHSHSGLTTETFREEGHYGVVERYVKPGDFFFIQFGHNDQKVKHLQARLGYRDNIIRYINECREKGVLPVLITPLARNTWKGDDGSYNDLLKEQAKVCEEIGREMGIPVLDLHGISMEFICNTGLEAAKAYFHPDDYTHSNDFGGYLMAGFVAGEIRRVCENYQDPGYRFLADCVVEGFGEWETPEEIIPLVKPEIYQQIENPCPVEELLSGVEHLEAPLDRAAALDMVIKTARFVPVNVYNDRFEDVTGHEWYAGSVESAWQNGIIEKRLLDGNNLCPEKEISLEEFLIYAMKGYRSKKNFPAESPCVYDEACQEPARHFVRAAYAIGILPADQSEDLKAGLTREKAVRICRSLQI